FSCAIVRCYREVPHSADAARRRAGVSGRNECGPRAARPTRPADVTLAINDSDRPRGKSAPRELSYFSGTPPQRVYYIGTSPHGSTTMNHFQLMVHAIERMYPQLAGCSPFVIGLLLCVFVCIGMYMLTRWTEWFVGFVG